MLAARRALGAPATRREPDGCGGLPSPRAPGCTIARNALRRKTRVQGIGRSLRCCCDAARIGALRMPRSGRVNPRQRPRIARLRGLHSRMSTPPRDKHGVGGNAHRTMCRGRSREARGRSPQVREGGLCAVVAGGFNHRAARFANRSSPVVRAEPAVSARRGIDGGIILSACRPRPRGLRRKPHENRRRTSGRLPLPLPGVVAHEVGMRPRHLCRFRARASRIPRVDPYSPAVFRASASPVWPGLRMTTFVPPVGPSDSQSASFASGEVRVRWISVGRSRVRPIRGRMGSRRAHSRR